MSEEIFNQEELQNENMEQPTRKYEEKQTVAETPKNKCSCNKVWAALSVISFIGMVILFVMHFWCNPSCKTENKAATTTTQKAVVADPSKAVTIGYINTDSIIKNYQYAKDLEKELVATQKSMEKNFQSKAASLQADFQNYLSTGSSLTLSEQKKKEESFKAREKELAKLQESMMIEIQQKQMSENTKLVNAIYAFVRDYNQKNQQFTVILKKSFLESPVLYIDENLDLTNEILDGLNKEYAEVKG